MTGVLITPLSLISETEKGATFHFQNDRTGEFMLGQRHAGSINGRHYHEGKSATKNPEVFILLRGEMELYAKNLMTGEELRKIVTKPSRVEFSPNVWHEIVALTDITFIELNALQEHIDDTKYDFVMKKEMAS